MAKRHIAFGTIVCTACDIFFRRALEDSEHKVLTCKEGLVGACDISRGNRKPYEIHFSSKEHLVELADINVVCASECDENVSAFCGQKLSSCFPWELRQKWSASPDLRSFSDNAILRIVGGFFYVEKLHLASWHACIREGRTT